MINFYLNGQEVEYSGDPNLKLMTFLRDHLNITTPKNGCSTGSCGACTVQIDDKAVLSCVTPMKRVDGKKVFTTEGLEQYIQDVFAEVFVDEGGIQCGFCTPGIVMSTRVLLMKNPNPTTEQIKEALKKHICRCTGYVKIEKAILRVARILRGEEQLTPKKQLGHIGSRQHKYDAHDTVLGLRPFVDDIRIPNMLFGALRFSDHPRAKILKIDTSRAEKAKGVIRILTAKDIPGERKVGLIVKDWPMMIAEGEMTHYIGDVLAQVIAKDQESARQAVALIDVEYEVFPPVTTVDQALAQDAPFVHDDRSNILSISQLRSGDVDKALAESAYTSTGVYYTQRIEHAFLEPESCVVVPDQPFGINQEKRITVYSQGQGAYEDRKGIAGILGVKLEQVNVIQVQNGGGFGGKEDLSVQGHAALACYLLNKPVKITLTREESMNMHPKRHPMRMVYKIGCDKQGKLTAAKVRIEGDTGAYASVGMKVLERAAGHATGGYEVPIIDLKAVAVYTNNVPCGAMRGFGVNQTAFALESCIDDLCEQGGFDRFDFRYKNALREGSKIATGQILRGGVGLLKTLDAVKQQFKQAKYAGIACGIKNTGIGNGMADEAKAKIVIEAPDHVVIHHGWTEMGQGVHTMAIQTVCEETGLSPDIMEVRVETKEETVCGMTTSSRGTSLVGNSLIDACKKLKEDLKHNKLSDLSGKVYHGSWICDWTTDAFCEDPADTQITHYSYGYATQVVILDEKTGRIKKVIAAHDAGRIMNKTLFEGQIEGAVHMGLGYALSENFPLKDGRPLVKRYSQLGILKAHQMPEIEVIGIEAGDEHGPYGAKGVGEIGLVPTAGAVANALYQWDKVRRYSLPIGIKK